MNSQNEFTFTFLLKLLGNFELKNFTNFRMNSELKTILKLLGNFEMNLLYKLSDFSPETFYKL
jgi:hypothetical protein